MANESKLIRGDSFEDELTDTSFLDMPEPESPIRQRLPVGLRRQTLERHLSDLTFHPGAQSKEGTPHQLVESPSPSSSENGRSAAGPFATLDGKPFTLNQLQSALADIEEKPLFVPKYEPTSQQLRNMKLLDESFDKDPNSKHPIKSFSIGPEGGGKLGKNFLAYCYVRNAVVKLWFENNRKELNKEDLMWIEYSITGVDLPTRNQSRLADQRAGFSSQTSLSPIVSSNNSEGRERSLSTLSQRLTTPNKTYGPMHDEDELEWFVDTDETSSRKFSEASTAMSNTAASFNSDLSIASRSGYDLFPFPPLGSSRSSFSRSLVSEAEFAEGCEDSGAEENQTSPIKSDFNVKHHQNVLQICRYVLKIVNSHLGDFSVTKEVAKDEERRKNNLARLNEADRKSWESWSEDLSNLHVPKLPAASNPSIFPSPNILAGLPPIPVSLRSQFANAADKDISQSFIYNWVKKYHEEAAKQEPMPDNDIWQYRAVWAVRFVEWAEQREKLMDEKLRQKVEMDEIKQKVLFCARKIRFDKMIPEHPADRPTLEQQKALWERHEAGEFDPEPNMHREYQSYGDKPDSKKKKKRKNKSGKKKAVRTEDSSGGASEEKEPSTEVNWKDHLELGYKQEEERRKKHFVRASTTAVFNQPLDED